MGIPMAMMDGGSLMRITCVKSKGERAVERDGQHVFGSGNVERAELVVIIGEGDHGGRESWRTKSWQE